MTSRYIRGNTLHGRSSLSAPLVGSAERSILFNQSRRTDSSVAVQSNVKKYKGIVQCKDGSRRIVYGAVDMVAHMVAEVKKARASIFKSEAVCAGVAVCIIQSVRFIDAVTKEEFLTL